MNHQIASKYFCFLFFVLYSQRTRLRCNTCTHTQGVWLQNSFKISLIFGLNIVVFSSLKICIRLGIKKKVNTNLRDLTFSCPTKGNRRTQACIHTHTLTQQEIIINYDIKICTHFDLQFISFFLFSFGFLRALKWCTWRLIYVHILIIFN